MGRCGTRKRPPEEVLFRNDDGEKRCIQCDQWLREAEFVPNGGRTVDSLHPWCRACDRFRRYGLTRSDVDRMLDEQAHRCPVCAKPFGSFKDFVVDHDQACCPSYGGKSTCGECVRGLLCTYCNVNVVAILEDKALVSKALAYLGKN